MDSPAAEKLGVFIKGFLKKNLGDEGYSDLFEHYIYAVKDKPRRQLAEFLSDYFYKTERGTWRLPASEEEGKAKREARVRGLGRRVKRYIAQLELGADIPGHERPSNATLAEWIRHCKRAGLYEQGKLLYEKGGLNPDNLPEEAMANVEEDYQVCARMLARDEGKGQRRKDKDKMATISGRIDLSDQRQASAERKRLLNQEMARYLRLLTEHGTPEKVILFGTLAKGRVHEWSDIDLVVVERTQLPFFQRIKKVRTLLKPKVGIDIMVYTPEEFDQLCADRPFFREEIIAKGKIVYEHTR